MADITFKLTRPQIAEVREKVLQASKLLEEAEDMLVDVITDEQGDSLPGDDPLSNLQSAVETTKEAYGDLNADSNWIEVQE